ncbi:AfsR/SARP family transcriptional regulator [Streptomyces olivaceiscleroticus]|uniref:OmpR/PhoB-type domain-containing protein n=1 Tax=Streptomyces olivaceiscleroticus TaxID=68245 RepID=A0ABN1BED7_9ACTN
MKIDILGPLAAELDGHSIVPSASKPRQVLALLALEADRVVPVPTLMEEVWASEMPRSATTTLQTYVLVLRRLLGAAAGADGPKAKQLLVTQHGGYRLAVAPETVDLHRYERLAAAGRAAFERGDEARAAETLRRALELWRGPALVDVKAGPVLDIELARLEESRLSTVELRIEAELQLGRHTALLAELAELTGRHPLHEGLHAQRMAALYRSGRAWQALQVFHELRDRLDTELGIVPSARLQQVHQAVLISDPRLEAASDRRPAMTTLDMFAL